MKTLALVLLFSTASVHADKEAINAWIKATAPKLLAMPQLTEATVRAEIKARFKGQEAFQSGEETELLALLLADALKLADANLQNFVGNLKASKAPDAAVGVHHNTMPTSGKVGPSPAGNITRGLGGVGMSITKTNRASSGGGVQITPAQMAELKAMTARRNQIAEMSARAMAAAGTLPPGRLAELK